MAVGKTRGIDAFHPNCCRWPGKNHTGGSEDLMLSVQFNFAGWFQKYDKNWLAGLGRWFRVQDIFGSNHPPITNG